MSDVVHIVVEKGPDTGMKISVPPDGARLGRSSRNDITLNDPLLSRHHCRLFFKTGEGLCVTDLGSANGTLVNDREIQEVRLNTGDIILLGDSVLKVVKADTPSTAHAPVAAPIPLASDAPLPTSVSLADSPKPESGPTVVDLGLKKDTTQTQRKALIPNRKILYAVLGLVTLLAVLAWVHKLMQKPDSDSGNPTSGTTGVIAAQPDDLWLDIEYEKIQATPDNIFRYHLRLKNNNLLIVKIDDLETDRHVRKEKEIAPELLEEIAADIRDEGFFDLETQYAGIQPGVLDQWDLTISLGKQTHSSKVINRLQPDAFEKVTGIIESFGKNELGLWAIQFSADKLKELADDAFQDGRKLYDKRDVAYGNLANAMKTLGEAEWYLETVEPKPSYYPELITLKKDCKSDLDERVESANFRAQRAIKMRQWEEASKDLRIIREMVPDRSDPRNKDATKSLLEVERRIKTGT